MIHTISTQDIVDMTTDEVSFWSDVIRISLTRHSPVLQSPSTTTNNRVQVCYSWSGVICTLLTHNSPVLITVFPYPEKKTTGL